MCLVDKFFSCSEKIATVILVGVRQIRQKPSCVPKTSLSILDILAIERLERKQAFLF